ncbi:sugar phosphate isomerase/epimerase family protein [Alteromonas confluentis]|uniref:Xylose isomerase-like TIM barrel domain-containing protein n=1 Tax=Alteromonas confluentis TaxID=1656094 RepID=A0A1E7Z9L7_9ALTE|nr:sugar phosphate isomerase/epimerase family protein [Alteromonas confluentis]OFC70104.1 hypothetical protein BFC18_12990 [Alteromonas confluentis]
MNKLAISNLAWTGDNFKVFKLLSKLGVTGVEVAPGKITGDWASLNEKAMSLFREQCEDYGLMISSFQAFLFGKPELQLLGDSKCFAALKHHIAFIAQMAQIAGATVLVYGAPKNRLLLGYDSSEGTLIAVERLATLAEICWGYNVSLGLEAVPPSYGGEIITSYKESYRIVEQVNHPGLVFHLDTGCTFLNNDSIADAIEDTWKQMKHFHISQPQLSNFAAVNEYHNEAASALNGCDYSGWHCIEMLESDSPLEGIEQAIKVVKSIYS